MADNDQGAPASPSGSQASPGAADASPPSVSIPSAGEYVGGLERALKALTDAAEADMCSDNPEGVDGGLIDDARAALRAKYPVVWTAEQVAALRAWQECGHVHPLTCPNRPHGFFDEDGEPLDDALFVTERGLFCGGCDYRQADVPEVCFGPLPPSPAEYFALTAQGMSAGTAETGTGSAPKERQPGPEGMRP